ncbi:MAG: hypothetical protein RL701_2728 [Pseudomonadota bacterium]
MSALVVIVFSAVALFANACAGQGHDPAPAASPPTTKPAQPANDTRRGPEPLRLRIAPSSDRYFELRPQDCAQKQALGCPFELRVTAQGRVLAERLFVWATAVEPFVLQPKAAVDADDPLLPRKQEAAATAPGLQTGDEASSAITTARIVELAPTVSGLLVEQTAGFEHVKRAHFLFAFVGDQLEELWNQHEDSGPTWSHAHVFPWDAQHEAVFVLDGATTSQETDHEADVFDARVLHWDSAQARLVNEAAGTRAQAVVLGPYMNLAAAAQQRARSASCLTAYWLLPAKLFADSARAPGYMFAAVGASAQAANDLLASTTACDAALHPKRMTLAAPARVRAATSSPLLALAQNSSDTLTQLTWSHR